MNPIDKIIRHFSSSQSDAPTQLIIGDVEHPVVEITPYQLESAEHLEELAVPAAQRTALQVLLQHAPMLGLNVATMLSNTYVLRFAPEVTAQLRTGSAVLMGAMEGGMRAIAVNSQGQIIGHGTLVAASGLNVAATAVAVWQVLALVTAQHYLPDIQQRLARMEAKLDTIQQWLEAREVAVLETNMKYLRSIGDSLGGRFLSETDIQAFHRRLEQIDQIDRECGQVFTTFRKAMDRYQEVFRTQPLGDFFRGTVEHNVTTAMVPIADYERCARVCLMAATVQGLAAEIRSALPLTPADRDIERRRLEDLREAVQGWRSAQRQFTDLVKQRAPEIQARSDLRGVLKNKQSQVKGAAVVLQVRLTSDFEPLASAIAQVIQRIDAQIAAESQPLELVVELNEEGQVAKVFRPRVDALSELLPSSPPLPLPITAESSMNIIQRLRAVPGIMDADWSDFHRAETAISLQRGLRVRTWKSPLGIEHVFVSDRAGACLYGGFVSWLHAEGLQKALEDIRREWEQ